MNKHDFSLIPSVNFHRSKFSMNHDVKTSFNVGELVPIDLLEVIPGDTFNTHLEAVVRTSTSFTRPIMDNLYMDIYHFFIPGRLVFDDFEEVFGKATPSMYVDDRLAQIPTLPTCSISSKSVGDYLGLPLGNLPQGISVLPFRAFALVYNTWFRNENIIDEVFVQTGELAQCERPNNNAWAPNNYMGKLPKVGKKKDYFTSSLPKPQKGNPVYLPLGGSAPVVSDGRPISFLGNNSGATPLYLTSNSTIGYDQRGDVRLYNGDSGMNANNLDILKYGGEGLSTDLSFATSANVNDLRFAFQLQKMLERDSLYGSRYNEYLLAHYGVSSPDSRLQLPEFLGGGRIPVQIQQVAQTSQSTDESPLAELGGFSLSAGKSDFVKGFTEHGFVLTVGCVRQTHNYQQGINKLWFRSIRNDFYDPLFANLGQQPIFTSEIFGNVDDLRGDVLGYNEAWAEYRYKPNMITGQMRSGLDNSLDVWHLGDYYSNAPTLTDDFINENSVNIDRVLSIPSSSQDNFIGDFAFTTEAIRVMPLYSVPGLIDHH